MHWVEFESEKLQITGPASVNDTQIQFPITGKPKDHLVIRGINDDINSRSWKMKTPKKWVIDQIEVFVPDNNHEATMMSGLFVKAGGKVGGPHGNKRPHKCRRSYVVSSVVQGLL